MWLYNLSQCNVDYLKRSSTLETLYFFFFIAFSIATISFNCIKVESFPSVHCNVGFVGCHRSGIAGKEIPQKLGGAIPVAWVKKHLILH